MRSSWFRRRKAFSLIELVVSVLVIVVLAAAGTVAFNQFIGKSSKTSATASATAIRDALQARATTEDVPVAELAETLWAAPSPLSELGVVFDGTVEYQPADGAETALLKVTGPGEKHSACIDLPESARTVPPVYPCTLGEHSGNTEEGNDDDGDFNSGAGQLEAPTAPTDMAAAWLAGNTAVTIAWSHDRVDVASFAVQRQNTDDTWLNLAAGLAPSATSFTDTDVSANTGYAYRVAAVNAAGETFTAPFTVPSATALTPTGVTAERDGSNVDIAWVYTGPTDGVTFTIERQEDTGGTWETVGTEPSTSRSHVDTTADLSTGYNYRVVASGPQGTFTSDIATAATLVDTSALHSLTAGANHTCGIDTDGTTWCWGNNSGQLGDGSVGTNRLVPTSVIGGHTFIQLTAGQRHTCGVDTAGDAWCWGSNAEGQLGDNTTTTRYVPPRAAGNHKFTALTAGGYHTCGLDTAGDTWCWGYNLYGQIGDGTSGTSRLVSTAVVGSRTFTQLSAGDNHTCGLDTNGTAWCWGNNNYRQVGDGTSGGTRNTPTKVAGNHTFTQLAAGDNHTCGIDVIGDTWCWGYNYYRQVGDTTDANRFTPSRVYGSHTFTQLTGGTNHTCGIDVIGDTWCWGRNNYGQVGEGASGGTRNMPTKVAGNHTFTQLTRSANHTCGVDADGTAWCWGYNNSGQIGDNSTVHRNTPTLVAGNHKFGSS